MENLTNKSGSSSLVALPSSQLDYSEWLTLPDAVTIVNWKVPANCNFVDITATADYIVRTVKDDGLGSPKFEATDDYTSLTPPFNIKGNAASLNKGIIHIKENNLWLSFRGYTDAAKIQIECWS